jgi:hypothetical protein
MDVPQESHEVSVRIDQKGFVPTLKQVTGAPIPPIESLRVGRLQAVDHPRKRNLPGFERQVNMVRHEAVGDQTELVSLAVMRQPAQVELPISVVTKDRFALVATDDHVVQSARKLDPRRPGHVGRDNTRFSSLTPYP